MAGVRANHVEQDVEIVLMHAKPSWIETGKNNGIPAFVWGLKDGLKAGDPMNTSGYNRGGWASSEGRRWCNTTFLESLPSGIKNSTKQVMNICADTGGNSAIKTIVNDYCFLVAEKEVFGVSTNAADTIESKIMQLDWYKTVKNRIKHLGIDGKANVWWMRSPYSNNGVSFCMVQAGGYSDYNNANYNIMFSPHGCF